MTTPTLAAKERTPAEGGRWVWARYLSCVLLLFPLLRFSITNTWDIWCTAPAVLGGAGLLAWGVRQRGALLRKMATRGARYGRQTLVSSLLLLALLVLANFLAFRHNRSFDLTESGLFTLSPQTQQVIRSLPRTIRLVAFFPTTRRAQPADLLRRYAEISPRLRYELVDPDKEPERAQTYEVTAYGTVVVDALDERGKRLGSGKPVRVEAEPGSSARSLLLSEEKLTNALLKVTRGGAKVVYFLEGHGEGDIGSPARNGFSRVRGALEGQAFTVKRLNLARAREVPKDCAILVIAGPGKEPFPAEISAVERYLQRSGKAMVLVDPAPGASLAKFLDRWGVQVRRDLVIDASGAGRLYGAGPALPLVQVYDGHHPITRSFRVATVFPLARTLTPKESPGDASVSPLAQTSDRSFAQPYEGGPKRARIDPGRDRIGPHLLAVAVTREAARGPEDKNSEGTQARMVVVGDSDFISNAFFDQAGNGEFFLGCANWLAEDEAMIAIPPRARNDRRVQLTEQQMRGVFWLVVVGLPLAALVTGGVIHWRRR